MKTQNITFLIAKLLLGVPLIFFGLNKFFGFVGVTPPNDPTAQAFLGAMFTSYLFKFVAASEVVGGVLLLIPRTAFLGALILTPVVANIAIFHLAHDLPGNGIWLLPTITLIIVLQFFKTNIRTLIS